MGRDMAVGAGGVVNSLRFGTHWGGEPHTLPPVASGQAVSSLRLIGMNSFQSIF